MAAKKTTKEDVEAFINGHNPFERIIKVELGYGDKEAIVIYRDADGTRKYEAMEFRPFLWSTSATARKLYGGDRTHISARMNELGIECRPLETINFKGVEPKRMRNGYRLLWRATRPMSYQQFLSFFNEGGIPLYIDEQDGSTHMYEGIMAVAPNEQFMIGNSMRYFKGYENYDDLVKMTFDLETEGLDPSTNHISQIGIRTNKGFEKILTIEGKDNDEKEKNEVLALIEFAKYIHDLSPDIICGHNTENFDWNFIDARCKADVRFFPPDVIEAIYRSKKGVPGMFYLFNKYMKLGPYKEKKPSVLKLGGEVEYYKKTRIWGIHVTDSLMAVRRAQALDSNMERADLKYVTKYSNLNKKNRVYMKNGNMINTIWLDLTPTYAFNDENGHWFKVTDSVMGKTFGNNGMPKYTLDGNGLSDNETSEKFQMVTGRYVIERYLLDDLYEGEKVEERYNEPNFLVGKMVPISFETLATGGTAKLWRYIMLGWSYENGLAIPEGIKSRKFTGGLSRLLQVGYNPNVAKFDYHSLYPTTQITFKIESGIDLMGAELAMLEHILTSREHFKALKGKWGKEVDRLKGEIAKCTDKSMLPALQDQLQVAKRNKSGNDKKQLPMKIFANSYFGSTGSSVFPWADLECAEETTCCGRQMLRLMIKHFTDLGYHPLVGDSVSAETPVIVKYDAPLELDGIGKVTANVMRICDVFDEKAAIDCWNGQYRDFSKKPYKVMTRDGWKDIEYVYRHKSGKRMYRMTMGDGLSIDMTEDHSIFDRDGNELKPGDLKSGDYIQTMYCVPSLYNEVFPMENDVRSLNFSLNNINSLCILHDLRPTGHDRVSSSVVASVREIKDYDGYVYDISSGGTFVCANGMVVCHNTDGFNFQIPDKLRYTDEHPYVSKGLCRYTVEGKKSTGFQADVDEFNDMYMRGKSALDIDEVIPCSVNLRRKNYFELLNDNSVKLVGNTVKSKKMPIYIKKFLEKGVRLLVEGKGYEFVEFYYDYIEKIYNLRIPLKDIASVGKIKSSIKDYKDACKQLTKSGGKKARQAWYELVIRDGLDVHMGDAIYYINTGDSPKASDVKRVSHYYAIDKETKEKVDVTKEVKRLYQKDRKEFQIKSGDDIYDKKILDFGKTIYPGLVEEDELIFNCERVPNEILEDEGDHYCEGDFEYNVPKYIEMLNNRIQPIFVCFRKEIRSSIGKDGRLVDDGYGIMIKTPSERKTFSREDLELCNGQPFNEDDQDTYEALMTMSESEVGFWLHFLKGKNSPLPWAEFFNDKDGKRIEPIYIDQTGMDWNTVKGEYLKSHHEEIMDDFIREKLAYEKCLEKLTKKEVKSLIGDGIIPKVILLMAYMDNNGDFLSRSNGKVLGNIRDIIKNS